MQTRNNDIAHNMNANENEKKITCAQASSGARDVTAYKAGMSRRWIDIFSRKYNTAGAKLPWPWPSFPDKRKYGLCTIGANLKYWKCK